MRKITVGRGFVSAHVDSCGWLALVHPSDIKVTLSRTMAKQLLPCLQRFVETGELEKPDSVPRNAESETQPDLSPTGETQKPLSAEEKKLVETVDDFGAKMAVKLLRLYREGRHGWDVPGSEEEWQRRLLNLIDRLIQGEPQEIDIANFAMFHWYLRLQKKNTEGDTE